MVLLALSAGISASRAELPVGADFLSVDTGIRASGLGGTYAAVAEGVDAVFWNPAGLGAPGRSLFGASHSGQLSGMNAETVVMSLRSGENIVLACGILYMHSSIGGIDSDGVETSAFSAYDLATILSFGYRLAGDPEGSSLCVGASAKLLLESIDTDKASGSALDIGCLFNSPDNLVRVGVCLANTGQEMKFISDPYRLPENLKIGGAVLLFAKELLLTADVTRSIYENYLRKSIGAELNFNEKMLLRAGYKLNDESVNALSLGFSFKFEHFTVEYAFVPDPDFGDMHRMGFTTGLDNILSIWKSAKTFTP